MTVVDVLTRTGGVADARTLVACTSRYQVAAALRRGEIIRVSRGRYALPTADEARRAAHRLSAVVTGSSAAAAHGWAMKGQPAQPHVTVPAKRRVDPERRAGIDLHWRDIPAADVLRGVLLPWPTVIDCAKTLPFDEALAIADTALRERAITSEHLIRLAEEVVTRGRARCMRVAREATPKSANPFESVLRAIALDVKGLDMRPQVVISEGGWTGRPDLVDVGRRLVVEAESFEFHGQRRALRRDCERYTALVLLGWRVIRFAWEHVMFAPAYVAECLRLLVAEGPPAQGQVILPRTGRWAA